MHVLRNSMASASIMTETLKGKSADEAKNVVGQFGAFRECVQSRFHER
jgi:NifU-like protein involved in Fe-S cluster formation